MSDFFERPILNSPYEYPTRHWQLDADGQPTKEIEPQRRESSLVTPVPKPKRTAGTRFEQGNIMRDEGGDLTSEKKEYGISEHINNIREQCDRWRKLEDENKWQVSPETARLLRHWRSYSDETWRPFFCQIEAVETAIWLAEVAPKSKGGKEVLERLKEANLEANPELFRIALKLATGAGKTIVMAMLIAWQVINAVRNPRTRSYSKAFLVITPGITIKDRLRVLRPNDLNSYYQEYNLVPQDMLADLHKARIVITNYHAFRHREVFEISRIGRALLQDRGPDIKTTETDGQMLNRVMGELMTEKNIVVLNDEAHHCYRAKPEQGKSTRDGEGETEAKQNNKTARLWITGIETAKRKLGLRAIYDLSATPFFLQGSGYREGTLFPWVVSDYSLMDAIESGIVKLPRVPISDNVARDEMPIYRDLWKHISKDMPPPKGRRKKQPSPHTLNKHSKNMPKKGLGQQQADPLELPPKLKTAMDALYGHYQETFNGWKKKGLQTPPVFIIVCNNTATSKLVCDYVSGFEYKHEDGRTSFHEGRLELFRNYDDHGRSLAKPRTILIDSAQLESGEALNDEFRKAAKSEIDQFRSEIIARTGDHKRANNIDDATLLREVVNTVGKPGKLGGDIRCVVSVSMLTEGWDANTVTHILGVRAFGTQLLCEQVVGRALRRHSYHLTGKFFDTEYADILGIPFDFTAEPVVAKPKLPRDTVHVRALPERAHLEIRFPRVKGYRTELPNECVQAKFSDDGAHDLELSPEMIGPSVVEQGGIVGQTEKLTLEHKGNIRRNTILYQLTQHLLYKKYRDPNNDPKLHLFGQLKAICAYWYSHHFRCIGDTKPGFLQDEPYIDWAVAKISAAITIAHIGDKPVKAILAPYNPEGSSSAVNSRSSQLPRLETDADKSHVNYVIGDSEWEIDMAEALEQDPRVLAYVKNHFLGFEVPYLLDSRVRQYRPDFIAKIDDGKFDDPLNLIIEVKGYRDEDAIEKANTMKTYWIPGVNNLGRFGRWQFIEMLGDSFGNKSKTRAALDKQLSSIVNSPDHRKT